MAETLSDGASHSVAGPRLGDDHASDCIGFGATREVIHHTPQECGVVLIVRAGNDNDLSTTGHDAQVHRHWCDPGVIIQ